MSTKTLQATSLVPTLTVNDLQASIKFYEGLGFSVSDKYEDDGRLMGVMISAGGSQLGLSQDDFGKGTDRVKGVGMRLYLETDQNIEELAAQARASGINMGEGPGPLPWGQIGFTVTDPDGFKMTISNPAT
ncbi:MAG TPA: VOC family protein [Candidatus Eisenbacteria bacterium]|nr:VOC family protein [Candidatus Eisenbacteria bacterium]